MEMSAATNLTKIIKTGTTNRMYFKDILICSPHAVCQFGIEVALKNNYKHPVEIRKCSNNDQTLQLFQERTPELLILTMPGMPGIDLLNKLNQLETSSKILVITDCDVPAILTQVMKYKVHGLIHTSYPMEQLSNVLDVLIQNKSFQDAKTQEHLQKDTAHLTKREYEVLSLVAKGHTTKEIATILSCSAETIKTHRANIMGKIKVRNTAEMTVWYLEKSSKIMPEVQN